MVIKSKNLSCEPFRTLIVALLSAHSNVLPWSQVEWELRNQTRGTFYRWRTEKRRDSRGNTTWWEGHITDKSLSFLNFVHINNFTQERVLKEKTPSARLRELWCVCQHEVKEDWCEWTQPVIVLADLAYSHQRFQVLVGLVGVDVVEGAAVSRVSVGRREVYCHLGQRRTMTVTQRELVGDEQANTQILINLFCFWEKVPWTESGSHPWCNPGTSTFWWSVRGDRVN